MLLNSQTDEEERELRSSIVLGLSWDPSSWPLVRMSGFWHSEESSVDFRPEWYVFNLDNITDLLLGHGSSTDLSK